MSIIRALSLPDRGAPFQYRLDELNELAFDRFLPMVKHEPRTILYVDNRVGYVLSHRLPWLRGAEQAGYDVHVTTLTEGDGDRVEEAGFSYHDIAYRGRSSNPLDEGTLMFRLYRLYRALRPDVVHLITLRSILYGQMAGLPFGTTQFVNGVTGLGYLFAADSMKAHVLRACVMWALRLLRRNNQTYLFQNPDDQRLFRRYGIISNGEGEVILGSGVDMDNFSRAPEPDGAPLVLFPARMLWHKGVDTFVEAARRVQEKEEHVRFVLVGPTDPDNPKGVSADQLEAWEEEEVVEWWGYQDDMPDVLARSHVVCLPSAYREGVPRVLIEAASCARPIVTTDVPGCREIVQSEENGYVVPPKDAEAIAEAILTLVRNPERRRAMGERGRERVRESFSAGHVVDKTLETYDRALKNPG